MTAYGFQRDTARRLKDLVRDRRADQRRGPRAQPVPPRVPQVRSYVAKVYTTITAADYSSGDSVGYGEVTLYKKRRNPNDGTIVEHLDDDGNPVRRTCYNVCTESVSSGEFIVVTEDVFADLWVAENCKTCRCPSSSA